MKIIEKILDNYYCNILKRKIENMEIDYFLDFKIEETEDTIKLWAKPTYYKYYTLIYACYKKDALLKTIQFEDIRKHIHDMIEDLQTNNFWNKGE